MGNLVFQATLGGQVNLVGPNTASTFNLNVPATSSTIATLTGTETFTNKTLTAPTLASANITTALTLTSAAGTSGQVLTSAGSGAAPTWTTVSASQWTTTGSNIYYSTGNVGIGSAPSAWSGFTALDIGSQSSLWSIGSGNGTSYYSNNLYYNGSARIYKTTGGASEYTQSTGSHQWYVAASGTAGNSVSLSEAMRITVDGYVLMGTTSVFPTYGSATLQVQGAGGQGAATIRGTSSNSGYEAMQVWKTPTSGDNKLVAWLTDTGASERGSVYYNRAGNAIVYATTSDRNLKKNIVDAPSALSKINAVKIRSFDWKETDTHVDFGVIAQELFEIAPEAVSQEVLNDDGSHRAPWTASSAVLVPALIKAVQELCATVNTQAETINALTARIVALETK